MLAKKMVGRVLYKENLAGDNWLLKIGFEEILEFFPGQYVSVKVDQGGLRRSYSVANLPGTKEIDLLIDVSPMGVGSRYVMDLGIGDEVEVLGFLGRFGVDRNVADSKQLLFVGTGTGIAPLKPMLEDVLGRENYNGKVQLVWGMRYEKDLYWIKEIDNLHRDHENFYYEIVLSKPDDLWLGKKGHVGDVISDLKIDGKNTEVFLCGSREMVEEVSALLMSIGVSETEIHAEKF